MPHKPVPAEFLGTVRVLPNIPEKLAGLEDLAYNLFWAWNPRARQLFSKIHQDTWIAVDGSPVRFISRVGQADLDRAADNPEVVALYDSVMTQLNDYMANRDSWFTREHKGREMSVAYFSAEFGLHESLPIYSGGLGILAGDHLKSASDIGIPLTGVGLLYREGYFIQRLDSQGHQIAEYRALDWSDLPIRPALDKRGNEVTVSVDLGSHKLLAKVWRVQVGRIPLFLLDSDVAGNTPEDRKLTARLYGGREETRIQQEILLGVGGVRALRALDISPTAFHMNEGHSVFLGLERIREYMHEHGLTFDVAQEIVRSTTLFTTHTPVPAGNDAFVPALMEKYFRGFWESIGLSRARFMSMGLDTSQEDGRFSLTILALNLASMANGVSELHGHVSRGMWQHVWADVPGEENPIRHITNGVHSRTWISLDMLELYDRYFDANWREHIEDPKVWARVDEIPDEDLWAARQKLRRDLVEFAGRRSAAQHLRFEESPHEIEEWAHILDPNALTIGFARRFATYKRATLIFRDRERLRRILHNPDRPVQIVFAGKAHPADQPGQELIRQVMEISRQPEFKGRIVFLENYDINIGRRLTSGVDVWLNNPRKPLEASGTSGMKVPLNGGINCSILDGWWLEAWKMNNLSGWALGDGVSYSDENRQDEADADTIYDIVENQIAPMFYDRDENGIPHQWIRRMRESMKTVCWQFSTNRMVEEYSDRFYLPGSNRHGLLTSGKHKRAKENAAWKDGIRAAWPAIRVNARVDGGKSGAGTLRVREKIDVLAEVYLGTIDPADVEVSIYVAPTRQPKNPWIGVKGGSIPMRPGDRNDDGSILYRGSLLEGDSGEYAYTVRVVPKHPDLVHPHEMGLVAWARPMEA